MPHENRQLREREPRGTRFPRESGTLRTTTIFSPHPPAASRGARVQRVTWVISEEMAKFISRASTGCRRKAREGARGDRAGGCGHGKATGDSQELARRHDAPSSSERPTSTRVPDTLPPPPRALAPHSLARHHVRGRQRLPARFRLGCPGESQASSREDHALKLRPGQNPAYFPALLLGRPLLPFPLLN